MSLTLGAALAVLRRDYQLWVSYRTRFASQALAVFFSLVLFYYISRLVRVRLFRTSDEYFAFVVIGLSILEVLTATLHTLPAALRAELLAGSFERTVVSPFGPVGAIAAMTLFPIAQALSVGALTIGLAAALFGLPLRWSTLPAAIPTALLGSLAFAPFALLMASAVLRVKQSGAGSAFVVTALALAGGAFFPVSLLPGAVRWVSDVQPFTPAVTLLRHEIAGAPLSGSPWVAAAKLAGFAIVLLPLSMHALAASVRTCQRRGSLIEY